MFDGVADHSAEQRARQILAIDVGDIRAEDERRLVFAGNRLQQLCLADGELDGIRRRLDQRAHALVEVFDPGEETAFIEKSMVDGDIETAFGFGVEESIEAE